MNKLTDIKEKIIEKLKKLTIDDFYSFPFIAKDVFSEITGLETYEDIEKYLTDKFPEIKLETLRKSLEQSLVELDKQIKTINKEINNSQKEIEQIEKDIAVNQEKQNKLQKRPEIINAELKNIENELRDIEAEINQLKPLSGKLTYDNLLKNIETKKDAKHLEKQRLNEELDSCPLKIQELKNESEGFKEKITSIKSTIGQKESEIVSIQNTISDKQNEIENLKATEENHFQNEYSSLEFLFKILLQKEIQIREVYKEVKTGRKLKQFGGRLDNFVEREVDEIRPEKTGEQKLETYGCSEVERKKIILSYTLNKNAIPKKWRNVLYETLSNTVIEISGIVNPNGFEYRNNNKHIEGYQYLKRNKEKLTIIDIATLLATKIAAKSNYFIKIEDNKIALAISGGIIAILSFREKGELIKKNQEQPFEIFIRYKEKRRDEYYYYREDDNSEKRFVNQTLYHQKGYADSEIQIEIPNSYYILTENFVIEIEYAPAPILFDNNSVIKFAPNISGKAKREDEIKEKEEEERRRWDDDDDWDD